MAYVDDPCDDATHWIKRRGGKVANVVIQHIDMPGVTSMEQAMRLARHSRTCRICGGMDRHVIGCPNGY